jgi:hypothetical protein
MNGIEWVIVAAAAAGLVIWVRGCRKKSFGSAILGLLVAIAAAARYFFIFSQTSTSYLAAMLFIPFALTLALFPKLMKAGRWQTLLGTVIALAAAAGVIEYEFVSMGNSLLVIEPYRTGKVWRFDEPRMHLHGEPFVEGSSEMIDKMVAETPGTENGVRLIFSQQQFPGAQFRLDHLYSQDGGNWYHNEQYQMKGWLCPALFKFFPRAPQHIYVRAEPKN